MSYNGSGVYTLPAGSVVTDGTTIDAADHNTPIQDIETALNAVVLRNGAAAMSGNLAMGTNKITGLGAGTAVADAPRLDQVQSGIVSQATAVGGTADAITLTFAPQFTAYTDKMKIRWVSGGENTVLAPTVNVSGLGTKTIKRGASSALYAGDTGASGNICEAVYNGTDFLLLNPALNVVPGAFYASTTDILTGTNTSQVPSANTIAALWEKGTPVASDTIVSLGEGGLFHITGTTTIEDIDFAVAKDGREVTVIFDGALTLTHSSTLDLPGKVNITTAAGDRAIFVQDDTDTVYCVSYTRAKGDLAQATLQAATSGTSLDFTSIPAGVRRITIMLRGVSTSGTSELLVQIGDSGGIEPTGYVSTASNQSGGSTDSSTAGFIVTDPQQAADTLSGQVVLTLLDAATFAWVSTGVIKRTTSNLSYSAGDKALSATLDRVRITTVGGTDTFDAGSVNIMYE